LSGEPTAGKRAGSAAPLAFAVLACAVGIALGLAIAHVRASSSARPQEWPSYADTFEAVAPSVVNVSVGGQEGRVGTGFAVGPDEVVTARHLVVDTDQAIAVRDIAGRTLSASITGMDARTDLALLRVPGGDLAPVALGRSEPVRVGDTVLAIGNPYGLGHTLSVGVVGQLSRKLSEAVEGPRVEFLQLSIPLNPGNSGGPVFGADGAVVAVLSGTHAHGQAIAFAVPVEALEATLPQLRAGARISRAFLGISTVQDPAGGLLVTSVIPSGPADKAGIRDGDALIALAGQPVYTPTELQARLDGLRGDQSVSIRLLRDGAPLVTDVQLTDWAEQPVVAGGMTLRPRPGTGGEVVAVRPRSRADAAGVAVGDVVRAVDGNPVQAPADVKQALEGGQAVQLEVLRKGMEVPIALAETR
jgi:serine protease Do